MIYLIDWVDIWSLSVQIHHPGPAGAQLLPGAQRRLRGAGRGRRRGQIQPEALASHGRHQEAPREVQGQQRHWVPVRASQRYAGGGGAGDGERFWRIALNTDIPLRRQQPGRVHSVWVEIWSIDIQSQRTIKQIRCILVTYMCLLYMLPQHKRTNLTKTFHIIN